MRRACRSAGDRRCSRALTFLILCLFAIVVGAFTGAASARTSTTTCARRSATCRTASRPAVDPGLHLAGLDRPRRPPRATPRASRGAFLTAGRTLTAVLGPLIGRRRRGHLRLDLGEDKGPHDLAPIFIQPETDRHVAYIQYAKTKRTSTTHARPHPPVPGRRRDRRRAARACWPASRGAARHGPGRRRSPTPQGDRPDARRRTGCPGRWPTTKSADLPRTLEEMLRELNAARTEIEAMLARQREFIADASHELRTRSPASSPTSSCSKPSSTARTPRWSSRRCARRGACAAWWRPAAAGPRRRPARARRAAGRRRRSLRAAAGEAAPLPPATTWRVDARGPDRGGLARRPAPLVLNLIENALRHTPPGTS